MANNQNQWLIMKECVLISIAEIKRELADKLEEYWATVSFTSMLSTHTANGLIQIIARSPQIVDNIIDMLLMELFMERQTDMRNAGQLELTEQAMQNSAYLDERTAHQYTEDLFGQMVNYLGMHVPHMTFGNHDGYQFKLLNRYDLLIYRQ